MQILLYLAVGLKMRSLSPFVSPLVKLQTYNEGCRRDVGSSLSCFVVGLCRRWISPSWAPETQLEGWPYLTAVQVWFLLSGVQCYCPFATIGWNIPEASLSLALVGFLAWSRNYCGRHVVIRNIFPPDRPFFGILDILCIIHMTLCNLRQLRWLDTSQCTSDSARLYVQEDRI